MSEKSKKGSSGPEEPSSIDSATKERDSPTSLVEERETVIHAEEKTLVHSDREEESLPSDKSDEGARLTVYSGPLSGHVFPLSLNEGGSFVVGRGSDCELVLDDGSVSRRHVEIRKQGPLHYISDLGSSNGTLVDNQLIHQGQVLQDNAEIKIGVYSFVFNDPQLKDSDLPPTLPVPYDPEGSVLTADDSVLYHKEESPNLRVVILGYSLFALFVVLLLFFGVRSILQEEQGGIGSVWNGLFGTGKGPQLAYPLLDVRTAPISGEIFFQGEFFGNSPQEKKLVDGVQSGIDLELRAEFKLPVLEEKVSVKKMIRFNRDQEISSHILEAPVGQIHIKKIPNNTQVILEYVRADGEENAVSKIKPIQVDYKDPILVPYGKFKLELRENEKFRYRRRIVIDEVQPLWLFEIQDKDITFSPITIETNPSEAEIVIDGTLLTDKTPLKDFHLSFGNHSILLRKENYKDYTLNELPNPLEINEPLVFKIDLPISPVGELILQAKTDLEKQSFKSAEDTLWKALKNELPPTPYEAAEIQYLLGKVYFKKDDFRQARIYFYKAIRYKNSEGKYPLLNKAKLGLARTNLQTGKEREALRQSVEVFFSSDDLMIKSEAQAVFNQVSPIKSVIYIDSIPSGAQIHLNGKRVTIVNKNGKSVPARTPIIIPDLSRGSYDIKISKEGYWDKDEKVRLDVRDLIPLKLKLKPK